eukprot:Skav230606  [mRNA]  locus=scaffold168:212376:216157:- [translate_table: standard]
MATAQRGEKKGGGAVCLIMLRILEAFSLSSRLNWLPRTLFLAKNKLQNFLIAYVCLVAGSALIMTLYFGDIFQQFSSLHESFFTLLLYSFGNTERATYGSKPFVEVGSNWAMFDSLDGELLKDYPNSGMFLK